MRSLSLILILFFAWFSAAETVCPKTGLNQKSITKKIEDFSIEAGGIKDLKAKQAKALKIIDEINCELDRTSKLPLDDEYRWVLSDYHSILSDLSDVQDCKNLDEKMLFNQTSSGTFSEEPLNPPSLPLVKKLTKGFCP